MKLLYSNTLSNYLIPLRDVQHGQSFTISKEIYEGTGLPIKVYTKWHTWIVSGTNVANYLDEPERYSQGWFTTREYKRHQNDLVEIILV